MIDSFLTKTAEQRNFSSSTLPATCMYVHETPYNEGGRLSEIYVQICSERIMYIVYMWVLYPCVYTSSGVPSVHASIFQFSL